MSIKHRFTIAACCTIVLCSGCTALFHPTAESFVSLQGRIANVPKDAVCDLQLFRSNGKPSQRASVTPEFKRALVIAPGVRKYYAEISCSGQPGKFRSGVHELGPRKAIDFGTITRSTP
jgi:hypothetical protein